MKTALRPPIWPHVWRSVLIVTALGYAVIVVYGSLAPLLV